MSVVVVRALLAAVFLSSGFAKLADREGVRGMVVEFGAPPRLAQPLAWILARGELAVAIALLVGRSAQVGGLAALVVLIAFGAAVAVAVGRGRRPHCHCFGRLGAGAVGWPTVARNALLASGAAFVVAGGRFAFAFAALAVAAIGAWVALRPRAPGRLRPGASAPELSLIDVAGQARTLDALIGEESPRKRSPTRSSTPTARPSQAG